MKMEAKQNFLVTAEYDHQIPGLFKEECWSKRIMDRLANVITWAKVIAVRTRYALKEYRDKTRL